MKWDRFFGLVTSIFATIAVPSFASSQTGRPISAEIISAGGQPAVFGHPGDVRVTLTKGRIEVWTHDGKCELPRMSKSGLVGWTYGTAFHSRGALMNDTMIIARNRKVLAKIRTFYPFIDVWDFTDADSCVIALSGGAHGPGRIEKFRIADGELIDGCYESKLDEGPDWAKRFLKEKSDEGTYVE